MTEGGIVLAVNFIEFPSAVLEESVCVDFDAEDLGVCSEYFYVIGSLYDCLAVCRPIGVTSLPLIDISSASPCTPFHFL